MTCWRLIWCTTRPMSLLCSPSMGGDRGGGLGKVNLTVYSLGLFSSSVASWLSSSWPPFFLPFCCFLVKTSLVCFSWKESFRQGRHWRTNRINTVNGIYPVFSTVYSQLVWWTFPQLSVLWASFPACRTVSAVPSASERTSSWRSLEDIMMQFHFQSWNYLHIYSKFSYLKHWHCYWIQYRYR